jgi:hypothetical protein
LQHLKFHEYLLILHHALQDYLKLLHQHILLLPHLLLAVGADNPVILCVPISRTPLIVISDFDTLPEIAVVKVPARSASLFKDVAISANVSKADGAAFITASMAS